MSKERPTPELPEQRFGFTERETLYTRLTDKRLRQMLFDEGTTIHKLNVDSNSFGEFLFATMSRPDQDERTVITAFGYGFHEYRDRWFRHDWIWYKSNAHSSLSNQKLSAAEARQILEERLQEIAPYIERHEQSRHGQLFELFAELSDDDGMLSELEDFPGLFDYLDDE